VFFVSVASKGVRGTVGGWLSWNRDAEEGVKIPRRKTRVRGTQHPDSADTELASGDGAGGRAEHEGYRHVGLDWISVVGGCAEIPIL
jgi:hypothetical protein